MPPSSPKPQPELKFDAESLGGDSIDSLLALGDDAAEGILRQERAARQSAPSPGSPQELSRRLAIAARAGDAWGVERALAQGADALASHDLNPKTAPFLPAAPALIWAAAHGHAECVSLLAPVSDLGARDAKGRSALALAIEFRSEECAAQLLDCAKSAPADHLGRTPLMLAAASGNARLVEALLPLCDAAAVDVNGRCAFWHAIASNSWLDAWLSGKISPDAATPATREALETLKTLARASGRGVDALDGAGLSALMFCAMAGHSGSQARLLIERLGANPRLRNCAGATAGSLAIEHENWEALAVLAPHLSSQEASRARACALAAAASGNEEAALAMPRLTAAHEAFELASASEAPSPACGEGCAGESRSVGKKTPAHRL